ncbi:CCHC-type domain-containing protein, partial [Durusdinium trenchii]
GLGQRVEFHVYDVNLTECDSEPAFAASHDAESGVSHPASSTEALTFLTALDDEVDGDYIEALVAQNDEDACAVQQFEQELEEFLQDTPSMHDALVTYIDARQKLQDKRKTRGFWPVQSSSNPYSKGGKKGKAAKGGGKGKKREQLLARIARSHCRACGERGHWNEEKPEHRPCAMDNSFIASSDHQGIRQVSEVLIQVLSMLLHCSLQIMENPTAIDAEGDMPVNELQTMLIELQSQLQSQRAMLEDVLEQLPNQRGASSPARAGTMRNPPSPSQAPGLQAQSETSETAWELKSKPSRHPFRQ